jgi:hypothetical protein
MADKPPPTGRKVPHRISFDNPPPPNLDHTSELRITGRAVLGTNPRCQVRAFSNSHEVVPAFSVGLGTGEFTITIAANSLWDNVLYLLVVFSDDPTELGSCYLDTRPTGV